MAKKESSGSTPSGPSRHRSPAYPATNLKGALAWARKIYDAEQMHETPRAVAVKHMGYSSLSGPAKVALATLKRFALVTGERDGIRVTPEARRYFLSPDEAERLELRRKFALNPAIIREIWSECQGRLPSEDTLKYRLVTQKEFAEESAKNFVRILRETIEFAELPAGEDANLEESPKDEPPAEHDSDAPHQAERVGVPPARTRNHVDGLVRFQLSDGNWVELHSARPLNAETIEELKAYLDVYERVLKKQVSAEASQGGVATR